MGGLRTTEATIFKHCLARVARGAQRLQVRPLVRPAGAERLDMINVFTRNELPSLGGVDTKRISTQRMAPPEHQR